MTPIRIGVTGIGGGVGQSILKALELSDLKLDVVRMDIKPNAGFIFKSKQGFTNKIVPNLKTQPLLYDPNIYSNIQALIPGSDYDLEKYAEIRKKGRARGIEILISDYDLVIRCCNKFYTYQLLSANNILCPMTSRSFESFSSCNEFKYPFIIKPQSGSASRGVHLINDEFELNFYKDRIQDLIYQQYIDGDEYTCSVFCDSDGPIGTFIAKRILQNGTTVYAEVMHDDKIHDLLVTIGEELMPRGPLNVQLRKDDLDRLWIIELNSRCSGTTAIRAHFGYNEPDMMIRHFVFGEKLKTPKVKFGEAYRYWNEVYI